MFPFLTRNDLDTLLKHNKFTLNLIIVNLNIDCRKLVTTGAHIQKCNVEVSLRLI